MALFNRNYSLLITNQLDPSVSLLIRELRIKFNIEKSSSSNPNKASIELYNLAPTTRSYIESQIKSSGTKGGVLILNAGYAEDAEVIFVSTLYESTTIQTKREGADVIYHLELTDGGRNLEKSTIEKSFTANTNAKTVLNNLSSALDVPASNISEEIDDELTKTIFTRGYSVTGSTKNELDKLSKLLGLRWSIQDGSLVITKEDSSHINFGVHLTFDTGLISAEKNERGGINATSLLIPKLRPQSIVQISTKDIDGYFLIEKVTHVGDSEAEEWYSNIETKKI